MTAHLPWTPTRIAGALLLVPSVILFVLARLQLGNAFIVQAEARHLVTSGLYSRIRHPIYLFGGLLLIGLALFLDRPRLLFALLVIIPLQIVRMRREDAVLAATFGEEYARYRSRTWF